MAKGAAMIGPRMATMLAFLLTDAPRRRRRPRRRSSSDAVEDSFNCISVEGHTSTNDTVLLLASTAPSERDRSGATTWRRSPAWSARPASELARMIADDGEGATHFITIDVEGCRDREQARAIARAVADSPLVKTAIHGADPNWGRIVSAAGYAGVAVRGARALALAQRRRRSTATASRLPFDAAAALGATPRRTRDAHPPRPDPRRRRRSGSGPAT